jgi:hypothetical protein
LADSTMVVVVGSRDCEAHRFCWADPIGGGVLGRLAKMNLLFGQHPTDVREFDQVSPPMEPIRQMCSYSHEDRRLMMRLHQHFEVLRREKLMVHWWDREIGPGSEWRGVVDEHLNTAQISF